MATESPLLHDGSQTTLSTSYDARRSSISGTTNNGPNGSMQFLAFALSTINGRQVVPCSTLFGASTAEIFYGILQNTPAPGTAADIGIFGITKAVAGSTISAGIPLQTSSTSAGMVVPWASGNGRQISVALENAVVSQVFTMFLCPALYSGST
jgi:hypothetical protein